MNGEAKFRAWDKVAKQMTPHNFTLLGEYLLCGALFSWQREIRSDLKHSLDGSNDLIITQFTGIKDSKGVEIYGGDIVYIAGFGNMEIVFPFFDLYEKVFSGSGDDIGEIIGNIYENPELLNS